MPQDMPADEFRTLAERHGLALSPEEAAEALAGANRWRNNVEQLRTLLTKELEPAPVFKSPGSDS